MKTFTAANQTTTLSSSNHSVGAISPSQNQREGGSMNTFLSQVKKIAVAIIFIFAAQLTVMPAQNLYAGCAESATKSAITTGVVAVGLLALDCLFGCPVAIATAGTTTAAAIAAAKAALLAALYGCVDATLWDKSSPPSPQPSR